MNDAFTKMFHFALVIFCFQMGTVLLKPQDIRGKFRPVQFEIKRNFGTFFD